MNFPHYFVQILKLFQEFLINPVTIQIGQRSSPAVGIRHAVYPVPRHLKTDLLEELLRMEGTTSAIVFVRTKRVADKLTLTLKKKNYKVSVLHGDRSQNQRVQALDNFKEGYSQVLVATDIAARGIDVEDVSHVINYDIPLVPEDYIHRIGRTGRVDAKGDAFSLMDRSEENLVRSIERILNKAIPRVKLPDFNYTRPAPQKSADHHHHNPRHGQIQRHFRT